MGIGQILGVIYFVETITAYFACKVFVRSERKIDTRCEELSVSPKAAILRTP